VECVTLAAAFLAATLATLTEGILPAAVAQTATTRRTSGSLENLSLTHALTYRLTCEPQEAFEILAPLNAGPRPSTTVYGIVPR